MPVQAASVPSADGRDCPPVSSGLGEIQAWAGDTPAHGPLAGQRTGSLGPVFAHGV